MELVFINTYWHVWLALMFIGYGYFIGHYYNYEQRLQTTSIVLSSRAPDDNYCKNVLFKGVGKAVVAVNVGIIGTIMFSMFLGATYIF